MAKSALSPKETRQLGGKRQAKARGLFDANKLHTLEEAIKIAKSTASAKFDETLEVALNLGVDPRKSDQMVRGVVSLPHGTGKTVRVAVFARDDKAEAAKKAGADIVGAEDLVEQIQKGELNFDRCIATPDMMALVGRVAKVLGPRGLMPNPKLGTVTPDVEKALETVKAGQVEFRAEKNGIVHAGIGKASFDEAKLLENANALLTAIQKAKPSASKGTYMKRVALSLTMGPGVKVDPASLDVVAK